METNTLEHPPRKEAGMRLCRDFVGLGAVIAAIGCSVGPELTPAPAAVLQNLGTWLASGGFLGLPSVGSCAQQFSQQSAHGTVVVRRSVETSTSTTKVMDRTTSSSQVTADYEISPAGRYGVSAANLVRVDCATLRVLGLSRKD